MNILFVTEDLPASQLGGAGKHAVLLANALIEAGHNVEMLGRLRPAGVDTNNGFMGQLHTDIDLHGTGWKEASLGVFLPMRREHMARRVKQAIDRIGKVWDVIHYHGHIPGVGAQIPAGCNFIHTLHDQGAECMIKTRFRGDVPCVSLDPEDCAECATVRPNPLQRAVSAHAVRFFRRRSAHAFSRHKAIFVSAFIERRFQQVTGANGELRSRVIHNFVNSTKLGAATGHEPIASSRPTVFMAGRIDAGKGFGLLLASLPAEAFDKLNILIAGDGPDLESLRAQYGSKVCFLGWQSLEAVAQHTAISDVCVVPSIWDEPCATTVLEALALRRPVYALRRGGTPELVRYAEPASLLHLFDDMASLAVELQEAEFCPPAADINPVSDVIQRLPDILDFYRS